MVFEAEVFKVFVMAMVRFSGLIISAPVLGSANFPVIGKIGLAALCAAVVTPTIPALETPLPDSAIAFALIGLTELAIGLMMGFVLTIVFAAVVLAGQIMDMLSGFALVNVFNPALETQVPIFGFFLFILASMYLLVIDGHHLMIYGLASTFGRVPIGGLAVDPSLPRDVAALGRIMFYDGFVIAAPIAGAMLLTYATLGLLGRVIPQMHLLVVGFPMTIGFALLLMSFLVGFFIMVLDGMFHRMFEHMSRMVGVMG